MLRIERVTKRFGPVVAVDDVDLKIQRAEVHALLGPNGAGKTSLVRMLVGLSRPDAGRIEWSGAPARLGYIPEDRGLYRDRRVLDILVFFGRLYGLRGAEARARAQRWLEHFGLEDRGRSRLQELSKGNQQKVQLIAAIVHEPELLVLDEPFSGFDPVNQERVLDLVDQQRRQGTTVLLSAHQMDLVERIADRITLMSRGRIVRDGTLAQLRASAFAGERHRLHFDGPAPQSWLDAHPAVSRAELVADADEPRPVDIELRPGHSLGRLLTQLPQLAELRAAEPRAPRLHEIYLAAVADPTLPNPVPRDQDERAA